MGVTVVLITASYRDQEFVRVGYYVTNEYEDPEMRENPPSEPQFNKLIRTIAANEPRVTKFKINWESSAAVAAAAAAAAATATSENNTQENNQVATTSMDANHTTSLFQSSSSNQLHSQANINGVAQPMESDKLENKENILMQQQKGFNTDSKLDTASITSQNHLVESSYDSIMS